MESPSARRDQRPDRPAVAERACEDFVLDDGTGRARILAGEATVVYRGLAAWYGEPGPNLLAIDPTIADTSNPGVLLALTLGLPLLFCYGIVGLLLGAAGAILGHIARRQTIQRGQDGGSMALAGIIIGWIDVALGIIIVIFLVWVFTHFGDSDPNAA